MLTTYCTRISRISHVAEFYEQLFSDCSLTEASPYHGQILRRPTSKILGLLAVWSI
jgi:hypothetical protein